MIEKY